MPDRFVFDQMNRKGHMKTLCTIDFIPSFETVDQRSHRVMLDRECRKGYHKSQKPSIVSCISDVSIDDLIGLPIDRGSK